MKLRCLVVVFIFSACIVNVFALDREAFTPTSYDLEVQLDPEQHRMAVHGKLTLRNDSQIPQKLAVLQISSSLSWHSVKAGDTALQFVAQPFRSDIDHTGALSEAIITLPQTVAPKSTIELEISYEGVVVLDATRLTSIGTPEAQANSADWDQIGSQFTAVRGAGYVAWYPITTDSADLAEPNSLFDVLGRWKARASASRMEVGFGIPPVASDVTPPVIICGGKELHGVTRGGSPKFPWSKCSYQPLGLSTPAFAIGEFTTVDGHVVTVYALPADTAAAEAYANASEKAAAFITEWFGVPQRKAETVDLPYANAAPFESGSLLLSPLTSTDPTVSGLVAAHQLTHAGFNSARPWINEGLAHFAQALYIERQQGRKVALDYMELHRSALSDAEKPATPLSPENEVSRSLLNTSREDFYRTKAMYVWWMLRDMLGDGAFKKVIAAYRSDDDKDSSYLPRLVQAQTQRNLDWFFDDWVNRDRGLPSLRVSSAFARKATPDAYLLTITIQNSGGCGAEVPIRVRFAGGELARRVEARAKASAVVRVDLPKAPQEVIINDGSVPESGESAKPFQINIAADDNK